MPRWGRWREAEVCAPDGGGDFRGESLQWADTRVTLGQLLTLIPVQRGWVHTYMHVHIHPKAHTKKRQPLKACLTPVRQTSLALAHSPGGMQHLKNSSQHLHTHLEIFIHPLCFRCPWRAPKPCSSACCSWQPLRARVDRPLSQAATCTVSDSRSRELGGSEEQWTGPRRGRQDPRGTQ